MPETWDSLSGQSPVSKLVSPGWNPSSPISYFLLFLLLPRTASLSQSTHCMGVILLLLQGLSSSALPEAHLPLLVPPTQDVWFSQTTSKVYFPPSKNLQGKEMLMT